MIKFECQCGQVIEAPDELLGEQVQCPACSAKFLPEKFLPLPPAQSPAPKPAPAVNKIHDHTLPTMPYSDALESRLQVRRQKIKDQANTFCGLAVLLVFVGVLAAVAAVIGDAAGATLVCAGSFGTALWLYLVGQIIHIRANTEK